MSIRLSNRLSNAFSNDLSNALSNVLSNRLSNALLNTFSNALLIILSDKEARNINLFIIINNKTLFYDKLVSIKTCYYY